MSPEQLLPKNHKRVYWKERIRNAFNRLHTEYGLGMGRYRKASKVLACTVEMSQVFSRWGIEAAVMPNIGMVTPEASEYTEPKKKTEKFKLLFVGRIFYWKGLGLALEALKQLPSNVELTVVGAGGDKANLEGDVESLGLSGRVNFLGSLQRSELLKMYEDYDLFVFPSFHDSGGFVLLEAMSAGMPVVCLDAGGPALIVSKDCGEVVPIASYDETVTNIKDAVASYVNDPDKLMASGGAAWARIKNEYDWTKKAEQLLRVYAAALETTTRKKSK